MTQALLFPRWRKLARRALTLAALLTAVPAFAAGLVLGSKNFTEQHLLSEITSQYLNSKGYQVTRKPDLATVILRNALVNRQLTWLGITPAPA